MMNIWLRQAARVDVLEQCEGHSRRSTCHKERKWYQIPVPKLKLLMASRNKIYTSEIHNCDELDEFSAISEGHF